MKKYNEIVKLHNLLEKEGIPHTFEKHFDGWQVCYPFQNLKNRICDAVEFSSSYGNEYDLLELMGLLTPEEKIYDEVVGHLTAEEIFNRIKKHWKEWQL